MTTRVVGAGYRGVVKATGGRCRATRGMHVCNSRWPLFLRGGTTLGNTFTTGWEDTPSRSLLRHERKHVAQWRRYGIAFPLMYLAAGSDPCRNRFEREAGLSDGGYRC